MSVSRQTTSRPACRRARASSRRGARVLERLHEGAVPHLDVEHDRVAPPAIFFDMIEDAISGQDVDGRGDVAEAVELLVGRNEVGGLADDRQARRP
jgi:hypothetical protein